MFTIDEEIEELDREEYQEASYEGKYYGSKNDDQGPSTEEKEKEWDKRIIIGYAAVIAGTIIWAIVYLGVLGNFLIDQSELRREGERFYELLVNQNALKGQEMVWSGNYLPRTPASEDFMNWIKSTPKSGGYSKLAEEVFFRATKRMISEFVMVSQPRKCIFLETGYGRHKFIYDIGYLEPAQVMKIALIFSPFPKGIDIEAFNKQRISELLNRFPELADERIEWEIVEQYSANTDEEAKGLLHGFLVEYTEEVSR